jgi:ATP-dependent helicase/nuclease subunit B
MTRHFLDWTAPVTQRVCEYLLPAISGRVVDLSTTLTIVPTRQAGRRLSEAMVRHCAEHDAALLSSSIVTPAYLLQPERPNPDEANNLEVKLAWCRVLIDASPDEYEHLFPRRFSAEDFHWVSRAGDMIQRLRHSLADGAYRIHDVIDRCRSELEEPERWETLAHLETLYLSALRNRGLQDPILQRIESAGHLELSPEIEQIVVAAVPDPSLLVLRALKRLAAHVDIAILVHAPPDHSHCFDEWGRPMAEPWCENEIPIPDADANIILAGSPVDQSQEVLEQMATAVNQFAPGQIALGVPDDTVTGFLETALSDAGLRAFDPADRNVKDHPLFRLLEGYATLVTDGSYDVLRRILRHPDMLECLQAIFAGEGDHKNTFSTYRLLEALDRFQNMYLPADFAGVCGHLGESISDRFTILGQAIGFLQSHVDAFHRGDVATSLRGFLKDVYTARQLDSQLPSDVEFESVASKIDVVLRELEEVPSSLRADDNEQTLHLFMLRLEEEVYHRAREESTVDLEGWLELPWNDAPFLIVTGMNEGMVPDGRVSDVFLPDSLRQKLDLRDDRQRLARDSYLIRTFVESRCDDSRVCFVVGKTTRTGDPLKPSRLLFRCTDADLIRRAERLFGPIDVKRSNVPATAGFKLNADIPPDLNRDEAGINRLSVTAFREFLTCPFRFYLRRILGMETLDDEKPGMDALDFGTLVHDALKRMAQSDIWQHAKEETIREFLCDAAEKWVRNRYGKSRSMPIMVALDSARRRLAAAARVQADLTRSGWQIVDVEKAIERNLGEILVVGTIDRIDRHSESGAIRIIDYKTSDRSTTPEAAHLAATTPESPAYAGVSVAGKARRWTDLQLPLYYSLFGAADTGSDVDIAYFNLPKAIGDTRVESWDRFDKSLYASAMSCANAVVDRVRSGDFWPPVEHPAFDDFKKLFHGPAEQCLTQPAS